MTPVPIVIFHAALLLQTASEADARDLTHFSSAERLGLMSDPETFVQLNSAIDQYLTGGREPSAALLLWFLVHVKRFDVLEAEDAICDGHGDKGIDGLWVDHVAEEIGLLQGKRRTSLTGTQGDSDISKLVGASSWFSSPEQVDALLAAGPNAELKGLVKRNDVRRLVDDGYVVRCVFVTNTKFDVSGSGFLAAHASGPPPLEGDVWARVQRWMAEDETPNDTETRTEPERDETSEVPVSSSKGER